ncbi:sensor histidine kinase [Paractinoplanes brasiliensis]|uniref:histidine kinase n=1 Tax=Paractinoplanes brasiliensis TaxID=52695 RepID=A0A4R6J991_9ACTN|nr:HAMP domain-containing sensor histidine kinase [Actinoplanes brasiliensis]TDO31757.1 signal transduction histidine kinase [Actinoplanes brasiliensis]GID30651.1 two-component sensor histidine kinase [Actinoplanes brasiliensis]
MRGQLRLLVLATTSLMMIAFLVPLAFLVRQVAQDRATVRATADVQGIITDVGRAAPDDLRLTVETLAATSGRPITVYLSDGTMLGTPQEATPAVELARLGSRSLTVENGGAREIVVSVQGRDGTAVIRTVVSAGESSAGVTRSWLVLSGLGALLVALGVVVADRLARTITRPISDLSAVSHRLANAELTARASPSAGGPPEVREVAGALNHLAGRIQELLRAEREQVADLSHRLRTPLTALRLEAEGLRDPSESARLSAAADALERAVSGLIQQARRRADPDSEPARCDAASVVADRVAFWAVLAEDTGRSVTVDLAPGPQPAAVSADELAAAVDALLGNVFAHTPEGTPFSVRLEVAPDGVKLTIADRGPGMPDGLVRRGVSGGDSTGLGLDIARRAARGRFEIHGGSEGGSVVTMLLTRP